MPSETDSSIEQKLRTHAERRREAAKEDEFKIHPVTRNSLKVEIVKQYGRRLPGAIEERSIWSSLWPKFVTASGGVFILVIAYMIFRPVTPNSSVEEIALADQGSPPEKVAADAAVPRAFESETTGAPTPMAPLRTDLSAVRSANEMAYQFYAVKPIAVLQTVPATLQPEVMETSRRILTSRTSNAAEEAPAQSVAPLSETMATSRSVSASVMLASFQFRMDGDRVTVIDSDQSEYVGRIRPINPETLSGNAGDFDTSLLGDSRDPNFPQDYRLYSEQGGRSGVPTAGQFTVNGTNLTSGKTISFTGRMLTWTQAGPATSSSETTGPSSVIQIRGTATAGGEPPLSIHASTSPQ